MKQILAFLFLLASFPAQADELDPLQKFQIEALWALVDKTPEMAGVNMIIISGDASKNPVQGWLYKTNHNAPPPSWPNKRFLATFSRPCNVLIKECVRIDGIWSNGQLLAEGR